MFWLKIYIVPYSKNVNTVSLLDGPSLVKEFYMSISTMSKSTARQYLNRLGIFSVF